MIQAFAMTTIHRCLKPGIKDTTGRLIQAAEIQVVPAETILPLEQDEFDDLAKAGAVRRATTHDAALLAAEEELTPAEIRSGTEAASAAARRPIA